MTPADRLYVCIDSALGPGARLAQCAHAVAEMHAADPARCAAWRESSNTVVVLEMDATRLS